MNTKLKKTISIFLIAFTCFFITSCNKANNSDKVIGIRGVVKEILGDNIKEYILVEGKIENDTIYDKAGVNLTKNTVIKKDSLNKRFKLSEIKVGDTVEVNFKGAVAQSYPIQGVADVVRIITLK